MPNSGGIKIWTVVGKGSASWSPQLDAQSTARAAVYCSPEKRGSNLVHSLFQRVGMLRGPGWSGLELIKGLIFSALSFLTAYPNFHIKSEAIGFPLPLNPEVTSSYLSLSRDHVSFAFSLFHLIISIYLTLIVSGTPATPVHASVLTPFHGFIVHMPKLYILSRNLSLCSSLN